MKPIATASALLLLLAGCSARDNAQANEAAAKAGAVVDNGAAAQVPPAPAEGTAR